MQKVQQHMVEGLPEVVSQLAEKASQVELDNLDGRVSTAENGLNDLSDRLSGVTVSDLVKPFYIAHRESMNIFPEGSAEAYCGSVNLGVNVIEMDVRLSADGTLVLMHDSTMDRTTNRTGNVSDFSEMGFKRAAIDSLFGWSGEPAVFEDLLRGYGNKVIYVPEIKDNKAETTTKLVDLLIKYNLQENCIIQSFVLSDLDYAKSKGLRVLYLTNSADPASLVAQGVEYVGISVGASDAYITSCINAGLKTLIYTVNRRYQRDRLLALGVHGIITDDPLYVRGDSPVLNIDPFNQQVFSHGQFSPSTDKPNFDVGRGEFIAPNNFGWPTESAKRNFSLQGWAGKLPNNTVLEVDVTFQDSFSATSWAGIALTPYDFYDDYSDNPPYSNGYNILMRENGTIEVFKRDGAASTSLGSVSSTAISQGTKLRFKVEILPGSIKVTRLSNGATLTVNDNSFRDVYVHFGRGLTGILFSNCVITRP